MTPEQFSELLAYIKENNCWGIHMYEINIERNRKAVKYVDACFDSRDGKIWKISFRSITGSKDIDFCINNEDDIKKIYEWLNEPMNKEKYNESQKIKS